MALVSISEAAKLVRRNRTTLYRDIEKGRLSKTVSPEGDARIDTSELLRVYGRLHAGEDDAVVGTNASDMIRIALLEEKNRSLERALALEAELRRVKDQVTAELRARIADKETTIRMLESRLFLLEREAGPHRLPPAIAAASATLTATNPSDPTDRPAPARARPTEVSDAPRPAPVQAVADAEPVAQAASVQSRPVQSTPLQAQPDQQPPAQQPVAPPPAMPAPPLQSPPAQQPIVQQPPTQQPIAQSSSLQHAVHVPVTPARPPAEKRAPPGRKGWLARLLQKKS